MTEAVVHVEPAAPLTRVLQLMVSLTTECNHHVRLPVEAAGLRDFP